MNSVIQIEFDSHQFLIMADSLFKETNEINPIYHPKFIQYYSSINKELVYTNLSFLLVKDERILIAAFLTVNDEKKINYFGNNGYIYFNIDTMEENSYNELAVKFKQVVTNKFYNNKDILNFRILTNLPNNYILDIQENIISMCQIVFSKFTRVIDLQTPTFGILKNFSKSVKNLRNIDTMPNLKVEFACNNGESNDFIENHFQTLRKLHFQSAGRITRNNDSWNIQKKMISDGEILLASLSTGSKIIASSMFYLAGVNAFYAVSAMDKSSKIPSLNHRILRESIFWLKEKGFESLHMGDQYSQYSQTVDQKILNIEKFKSFFGGKLQLSLLLER